MRVHIHFVLADEADGRDLQFLCQLQGEVGRSRFGQDDACADLGGFQQNFRREPSAEHENLVRGRDIIPQALPVNFVQRVVASDIRILQENLVRRAQSRVVNASCLLMDNGGGLQLVHESGALGRGDGGGAARRLCCAGIAEKVEGLSAFAAARRNSALGVKALGQNRFFVQVYVGEPFCLVYRDLPDLPEALDGSLRCEKTDHHLVQIGWRADDGGELFVIEKNRERVLRDDLVVFPVVLVSRHFQDAQAGCFAQF